MRGGFGHQLHAGGGDIPNAFTVTKASSTTTVTGGNFTYDTLPHAASVLVSGAGLSLTPAPVYSGGCSAAPVNVSETTPTACTASYTFAGDANHIGSSGSATITIDKAPTTTTVTATSYTYDSNPHGETASVSGPGLAAPVAPVNYTGTQHTGRRRCAVRSVDRASDHRRRLHRCGCLSRRTELVAVKWQQQLHDHDHGHRRRRDPRLHRLLAVRREPGRLQDRHAHWAPCWRPSCRRAGGTPRCRRR